MAENGNSKPGGDPSTTPEELKPQNESAPRQQPADEGNAASSQAPNPDSGRTPFSNLSQVDADLALARRLQEQERAYMMLRMNSGVFGSVGGSYFHVEDDDEDEDDDDEDFDDPELEHDDVEDSIENGAIGSVPGDGNGNRAAGHLHVSDGEEEDVEFEADDDVDASDAHIDHEDDDDDDDDDEDEDEYDEDEDDNLGVEFDPEVYTTDEAYARALQDAEEMEMAARLFAIAGIHDLVGEVTDHDDHGGISQDMWEEVDPDELSYEELLALGEVVGTESRGLSADRIASLPSVNFKSGSSQNGTNDSCVICRLDFEDDEILTLLSCKHSYHSECINNWLKINKCKCIVQSTSIVSVLDLLKRCKSMSELRQIHGVVVSSGFSQNDAIVSELISAASSSLSNVEYSCRLLLDISTPRAFHWNAVIRGYSQSKNPNRSISVFVDMLRSGLLPDHLTYTFVVKSAARLSRRELGGSIHSHALRNGFALDRFVSNSLIHMYGSCAGVDDARKVFDEMPVTNLVSWNSMVDGYAKCGDMGSARQLFDMMIERDVVSWSSLIGGYVKSKEFGNAVAVFEKMLVSGPRPNEVTMVSVLCACAHLGALDKGKVMHQYIVDKQLLLTLTLRTSLVDMYAKCGAIEEALAVFRGVPKGETDVLIWNAAIGGLATHGLFNESLDLFQEMQRAAVKPDDITYLCLLSACAHGGLVKEAWRFFECLCEPKVEHYASMVDTMARAGQVEEAYHFLDQMPIQPAASMLGALLSGCINLRKMDLAEAVGKKLIALDPDHDGRYVGLSNVYAASGRWGEARSMREAMEKRGVKKYPGYSYLQMPGALHRFMAQDKSHPCTSRIYEMLSLIVSEMKLFAAHESLENRCWYVEEIA